MSCAIAMENVIYYHAIGYTVKLCSCLTTTMIIVTVTQYTRSHNGFPLPAELLFRRVTADTQS